MKSDLRTVANEMETFFTDSQTYPAAAAVTQATGAAVKDPVVITGGNTVGVSDVATNITYKLNAGGQSYCIQADNSKVTNTWSYQSANGGLVQGACP
jgi:hypothetical protein